MRAHALRDPNVSTTSPCFPSSDDSVPMQPNSDFSPLSPGVAHWRLYSALAGFAPVESKAHQAQISRASHRSFTVATFTDRTPLHVALSLSLHTFLLLLLIAREKIGPKWRVSSKNNLERERGDRHRFQSQLLIFHSILFFLPCSWHVEETERRNGVHIGSYNGGDRRRRPDRRLGARHGSPRRQAQQKGKCYGIIPIWSMQKFLSSTSPSVNRLDFLSDRFANGDMTLVL